MTNHPLSTKVIKFLDDNWILFILSGTTEWVSVTYFFSPLQFVSSRTLFGEIG